MVQAQRTSSNLHDPHHHRAGWFNHSEPKRTYTNHTSTEIARCVGCFCTRSGWYKHSEPQRTYTSLTSTELARCVGCLCTSSGWFKHSEPPRTYTNPTITERARCVGCLGLILWNGAILPCKSARASQVRGNM